MNGIVPISMEWLSRDVECSYVFIRNFDAGGIAIAVFDSSDGSSLSGRRMRNQFNHRLKRGERFAAPIDGNVRKESVFDLIPFDFLPEADGKQ